MQLTHINNTSKDSQFVQRMVMNSNSIIILNLVDENPYCVSGSDVSVKYRHGNVIVKNTGQMSFALMFRVAQRYEQLLVYDSSNLRPTIT